MSQTVKLGAAHPSPTVTAEPRPSPFAYMRFARGGEGGSFILYGVPEGEYYLYVAIPHTEMRFYGVHRRITVVDGENQTIALDGT